MNIIKQILRIIPALGLILILADCAGKSSKTDEAMIPAKAGNSAMDVTKQNQPTDTSKNVEKQKKYKVTFIELGSVRCIPCQMMQPIMKSVEEKYGDQVKVVFYDVWTPEGRPYADQYAIQVIPTQVFLDKNGKEFFRHQGYFPEEELLKVLQSQGVK